MEPVVDKYEVAKQERQKYVDDILKSKSTKKIVVAGPGTGKTYLFKELLKDKKNALTLTFVNSLVEDLALELYGLSDVKTLHSFALSVLGKDAKVYPKLSNVIEKDAEVILGKKIDFDKIFHDRDDKNEDLKFYRARRKYYENYFGFSDIVFSAIKYLEENPTRVKSYGQVLVDEYQDFNPMEISLIDLLATKNPLLIVGDDDQALYGFKNAGAQQIRTKYNHADYEEFSLPYCSRCTRVLVDAVNDIISGAGSKGLLLNRINKEYKYFESQEKNKESNANQKIEHIKSYADMIPWIISDRIDKLARENKKSFSVLVISPTRNQSRIIQGRLAAKGFSSIKYTDKSNEQEPSLSDGLSILLENEESNLGWRIVGENLLKPAQFKKMLTASGEVSADNISELVDSTFKADAQGMLVALRKLMKNQTVDEQILDELLNKLGYNPYKLKTKVLLDELSPDAKTKIDRAIRKIPIEVTTITSSKGLASDYVFITHFDDQFFIKDTSNKVSDQDVCNLLVGLTRAKKKIFLISTDKTRANPIFSTWIKPARIEKVEFYPDDFKKNKV